MLYVLTRNTPLFKQVHSATLKDLECQYRVVEYVPKSREGAVVLICGVKMLQAYQDLGVIPKNRVIRSLRGKVVSHAGSNLLVTHDPYKATLDYQALVDTQIDLRLAARVATTGSPKPPIGNYAYTKDFTDVCEVLKDRLDTPVALDLETLGLDEYAPGAYIVSVFISYQEGESYGVRFKGIKDQPTKKHRGKLYQQLKWLLTTKRVRLVGANLKYDLRWIRFFWGLECTNFTLDTTLAGSLLDENVSNSLSIHTKRFTLLGGYDDLMNTKYNKGRMDLVPDNDLLVYAGGDTDACLRVRNVFIKMMRARPKLARFYVKLLHPAVRAFEQVEQVGIQVDRGYFKALAKELEDYIKGCEQDAFSQFPKVLRNKYSGIDKSGRPNLRLSRSVVIKDYLFSRKGLGLTPILTTAKTLAPSTAMNHLLMFKDTPRAGKFIEALKEYNSASKTLSTYVSGFLEHLKPDGRLHPTFHMYRGAHGDDGTVSGTVTGRSSATNPAVQTIPKHTKWAKKLRRGYVPPQDYVYVEVDFSQGELRITAVISKEPTMIRLYQEGYDQHIVTGARLLGYSLEEVAALKESDIKLYKRIRQGGKAGNFGLIYGMQSAGFKEYAASTYGVSMTLEEATERRDAFFKFYSRLAPWHAEQKEFARRYGYVQSPLGRIRHLPMIRSADNETRSRAERQAINSPVQATLSDLTIYSLHKFTERYGTPRECQFCMFTHDSLGAYIRKDAVEVWAPRIKEVMETLPLKEEFGWGVPITFVADVEVGATMGDMMDYDDWIKLHKRS